MVISRVFQYFDTCIYTVFKLSSDLSLHVMACLFGWFTGYKVNYLASCHYRSSGPEVFCRKVVIRNFAKFKGKHLCQSLPFNKVAGLRPATLLKKKL